MRKTAKKSGMSLIVLAITIIVMIILAGVVVIGLSKNNPIIKAQEATFKGDVSSFKEELSLSLVNQLKKDRHFKVVDLNAQNEDMKKYIPSMTKKYIEILEILEGELVFKGTEPSEKEWAEDIGAVVEREYAPEKVSIIEGNASVSVSNAVKTTDNCFVIVGRANGNITGTSTNLPKNRSAYISKIDAEGNILWTKMIISDTGSVDFEYVVEDKNGDYVVFGTNYGGPVIKNELGETVTIPRYQGRDVIVAKYAKADGRRKYVANVGNNLDNKVQTESHLAPRLNEDNSVSIQMTNFSGYTTSSELITITDQGAYNAAKNIKINYPGYEVSSTRIMAWNKNDTILQTSTYDRATSVSTAKLLSINDQTLAINKPVYTYPGYKYENGATTNESAEEVIVKKDGTYIILSNYVKYKYESSTGSFTNLENLSYFTHLDKDFTEISKKDIPVTLNSFLKIGIAEDEILLINNDYLATDKNQRGVKLDSYDMNLNKKVSMKIPFIDASTVGMDAFKIGKAYYIIGHTSSKVGIFETANKNSGLRSYLIKLVEVKKK